MPNSQEASAQRRPLQGDKVKSKGMKSLLLLVAWEIWGEQNMRVFKGEVLTIPQLVSKIIDEINLWSICGATNIVRLSA
uniref:Uncharacterized protein n=1 Tax=Leersia perrieri TaxID=77586 RepID=A0A0D9VJ25_9ORYZ